MEVHAVSLMCLPFFPSEWELKFSYDLLSEKPSSMLIFEGCYVPNGVVHVYAFFVSSWM